MENNIQKAKATSIVLAIMLTVAIVVIVLQATLPNTQEMGHRTKLQNIYEKSFFEVSQDLSSMDTNMSKLLVSWDSTSQQEYLTNIIGLSGEMSTDLSNLPVEQGGMETFLSLTSRVTDYAKSLNRHLATGSPLTDEQKGNLKTLRGYMQTMADHFSQMRGEMDNDFFFAPEGMDVSSGISRQFMDIDSKSFNYSTLIYDGAFSEGKSHKVKLNMEEISQEEAAIKVAKYLGVTEINNVKFENQVDGNLHVYSFAVSGEQGTSYVQITVNGGMICEMVTVPSTHTTGNSQQELSEENQEQEEAKPEEQATGSVDNALKNAEKFAQNLGYDVKAIWYQKQDDTMFVNLAPVVSGVVVYRKLVKVELENGEVTGFEGQNYLANMNAIRMPKAAMSQGEAMKKVPKELSAKNQSMALVPKNDKDILCYEFYCTDSDGAHYYVFVDAKTGSQVDIFKVIEGSEGYSVM